MDVSAADTYNSGMNATTINARFASNLREIRESRGLSQQALADAMACARGTITRYEAGRFPDSADVLDRLAAVLQVDVSRLVKDVK